MMKRLSLLLCFSLSFATPVHSACDLDRLWALSTASTMFFSAGGLVMNGVAVGSNSKLASAVSQTPSSTPSQLANVASINDENIAIVAISGTLVIQLFADVMYSSEVAPSAYLLMASAIGAVLETLTITGLQTAWGIQIFALNAQLGQSGNDPVNQQIQGSTSMWIPSTIFSSIATVSAPLMLVFRYGTLRRRSQSLC